MAVGIGASSHGSQLTVQPSAGFQLASLGYVPAGLTRREYAYLPALVPAASGQTVYGSRIPIVSSGLSGPSPETMAAVARLEADGIRSVWLRYSSTPPATNYIEVTERAAQSGQPLAGTESFTIGGVPATLVQQGDQITIQLVRSGTSIMIHTNLSRRDTLLVAQSLVWD